MLKDFLERKDKGELLIHKTHNLMSTILRKVELSNFSDGFVHFGDRVCLYNPSSSSLLSANVSPVDALEAKSIPGPCQVASSSRVEPCPRNTLVIRSCDGSKDGEVLGYGQHFYLQTLPNEGGELFLHSDLATFIKSAKRSRQQEVTLVKEPSYKTAWKIVCFEPQDRLESEGQPVPTGQKILINHCKTNQCLAALPDFVIRTAYGRELEIAAHTQVDSHKAEVPANHWVFIQEDSEVKEGVVTTASLQEQAERTRGLSVIV
jgi:hypothetical protein